MHRRWYKRKLMNGWPKEINQARDCQSINSLNLRSNPSDILKTSTHLNPTEEILKPTSWSFFQNENKRMKRRFMFSTDCRWWRTFVLVRRRQSADSRRITLCTRTKNDHIAMISASQFKVECEDRLEMRRHAISANQSNGVNEHRRDSTICCLHEFDLGLLESRRGKEIGSKGDAKLI